MEYTLDIISLPESNKLDFKEKYGFMDEMPSNIERIEWKKYIDGQWDEFCKDVIALCNGGLESDYSPARIVIGVKEESGRRIACGIDGLTIRSEDMLKKLNHACRPSITDVKLYHIGGEGGICIIEIPNTAKLLESSRDFRIFSLVDRDGKLTALEKRHYSKHCTFFRVGENTDIASAEVRDYLSYIKSGSAEHSLNLIIKECENNLRYLLNSSRDKPTSPIDVYNIIKSKVNFSLDGSEKIRARYVIWMLMAGMVSGNDMESISHGSLKNALKDAQFTKYLELNYDNVRDFYEIVESVSDRLSQLLRFTNNSSYSDKASELIASLPKNRDLTVDADSKALMYLGIKLFRVYDLTLINMTIISFFRKDYRPLLNLSLSPFYIYQQGINHSNLASLEKVRQFIIEETEKLS